MSTSTVGLSATNGRAIDLIPHVKQSLARIFSTLVGTRVMRREFGSLVPLLIDQPVTPAFRLQLISAAAEAVMRWEPRVKPVRIALEKSDSDAKWVFSVECILLNAPAQAGGNNLTLQVKV